MQLLLLPVTRESLVTSTGMVLSFIGVLFRGLNFSTRTRATRVPSPKWRNENLQTYGDGSLFAAEHPRSHHDIRFRAFLKDNLAAVGTIAARDRYNKDK